MMQMILTILPRRVELAPICGTMNDGAVAANGEEAASSEDSTTWVNMAFS